MKKTLKISLFSALALGLTCISFVGLKETNKTSVKADTNSVQILAGVRNGANNYINAYANQDETGLVGKTYTGVSGLYTTGNLWNRVSSSLNTFEIRFRKDAKILSGTVYNGVRQSSDSSENAVRAEIKGFGTASAGDAITLQKGTALDSTYTLDQDYNFYYNGKTWSCSYEGLHKLNFYCKTTGDASQIQAYDKDGYYRSTAADFSPSNNGTIYYYEHADGTSEWYTPDTVLSCKTTYYAFRLKSSTTASSGDKITIPAGMQIGEYYVSDNYTFVNNGSKWLVHWDEMPETYVENIGSSSSATEIYFHTGYYAAASSTDINSGIPMEYTPAGGEKTNKFSGIVTVRPSDTNDVRFRLGLTASVGDEFYLPEGTPLGNLQLITGTTFTYTGSSGAAGWSVRVDGNKDITFTGVDNSTSGEIWLNVNIDRDHKIDANTKMSFTYYTDGQEPASKQTSTVSLGTSHNSKFVDRIRLNLTAISGDKVVFAKGADYFTGRVLDSEYIFTYNGSVWSMARRESVVEFINSYMHPEISTSEVADTGACKGSNGYYAKAKAEYARLTADEKAMFNSDSTYADYSLRLKAWARANGEVVVNNEIVANSNITNQFVDDSLAIVLVAVSVTALLLAVILIIKKRKEAIR